MPADESDAEVARLRRELCARDAADAAQAAILAEKTLRIRELEQEVKHLDDELRSAPAATPRDVLEAVLRSAARERAHEDVSENVSDVSDVSSPLADARTRKETPALDALAAALFHPCHRDYVPAAFAAAAADAVREDAGRDQVGQGVGKKGTKEKADETCRSRSNETSVLDDEAPAAAPVT